MRTWKEVKEWLEDAGLFTYRAEESALKADYKYSPVEFFSRYMRCYFPIYCMGRTTDYLKYSDAWGKWLKGETVELNTNLPEYDAYYKHTKKYLCTVNAHSVKAELIKKEVQKLYPDVELLFYEPDKTRENWLKFYTYDKELGLNKI